MTIKDYIAAAIIWLALAMISAMFAAMIAIIIKHSGIVFTLCLLSSTYAVLWAVNHILKAWRF